MIIHIIILTLLSCLTPRQLKFIEVVSRHGVRSPFFINQYDHSNQFNKKATLTIQGKSMHYLLGKSLYQRYWHLLFNNTIYQTSYDQSLIYAKSTNLDRTIESLQCQLYGLLENMQKKSPIKVNQYYFPPFPKDFIEDNLTDNQSKTISQLFTFPIHVEQGAEGDFVAHQNYQGDFLVKFNENLCPNQKTWKQQNLKTTMAKKVQNNQRVKQVINKLNRIYNTSEISINNAYKYIDNYLCLKAMNKQYLPIYEDPTTKDIMQFLYIYGVYMPLFYTQQQRRVFSSLLIQKTITNINNAIANGGPKIVLYSAHDSTLLALLAAMNFNSIECIVEFYLQGKKDAKCYHKYPTFASTFIFGVWEQDSEYILNIVINGQRHQIPICNYSEQCKYKQFTAWFSTFKVANPNKQCGLIREQSQFSPYFLYAIIFCAGILVSLAIGKMSNKYSYERKAEHQFELPNLEL